MSDNTHHSKSLSDDRYLYYITIEAVDPSGARIDTDIIIADELNPKQKEKLTAFDYVPTDKIEQFKTAEFRVLEIYKY